MTGTPSYKDLLAQREALEAQINEVLQKEKAGAITQARELVASFSLTEADVFPSGRRTSSIKGTTVAPKYRNPNTGETWTGRGKAPAWIRNEDRTKFAI